MRRVSVTVKGREGEGVGWGTRHSVGWEGRGGGVPGGGGGGEPVSTNP